MRLRNLAMAGIILLMLAFVVSPVYAETDNATNGSDTVAAGDVEVELVDDIKPDEGMIGSDHVLYKLKIAFEDLDIAFTFNESEKVGKQVSQARHRLAEIKSALKKKNLQAAGTAIDQYEEETAKTEESISRLTKKDPGLVTAQSMIAKHGYVLERLIESHPNNTGLLRAYNNSERLLIKFSSKTSVKLERKIDKMGRKMLRKVGVEDDKDEGEEKTQVKASVGDNKTHVKVELRFLTNSTEPADIAGDILERIDAIENNVSNIIKIERDDEEEVDGQEPEVTVTGGQTATLTGSESIRTLMPSREKLKIEAEVKVNTSRVRFEYTFFLNATEDPAIITGVEEKLSSLTSDKILSALEVEVKEKKNGIREIKRDDVKKPEKNDKKQDNSNTRIDNKGSKQEED